MPLNYIAMFSFSIFLPIKQTLVAFLCQVKDGETEPLIILENGANKVNDSVGPKGPMWASNKDLHA